MNGYHFVQNGSEDCFLGLGNKERVTKKSIPSHCTSSQYCALGA